MENIVGGLADKSEDYIKRAHQDGKGSEIIYCGLTKFKQSQDSQLKNNDMMIITTKSDIFHPISNTFRTTKITTEMFFKPSSYNDLSILF